MATDAQARTECLAEVRACGYAEMDPVYSQLEYQKQVTAIGVPIMSGACSIASVNVIYLRRAITPDRAAEEVLPALREAAMEMAAILRDDTPFGGSV